MKSGVRLILWLVLFGAAGALGWAIYHRIQADAGSAPRRQGPAAAPVEVAAVERGPMELRRTFSGTLEATAEFLVAPKGSGRIVRLSVDLGDVVEKGQLVAEMEDDEFVQAATQASADLEVAKANQVEATNALEIATRELRRVETLRSRGVASASHLDAATAEVLSKESRLEVARAQVKKAEASCETCRIRLSHTQIRAEWVSGGRRVVAQRFVDEGETVAANTPLLSIVELDPITGVIFVTERDYARLQPGQAVALTADAYPGESFPGTIARIAPVFREATRQARVEIAIPNPRSRLKPGMFTRATVVLEHVAQTTSVPESALTTRGGQTGVFVVREDGRSVGWHEVNVGIRDGDRVQVSGEGLSGRVVTLGQQLVDHDSPITIPAGEGGKKPVPQGAAAR
ncbi:MAG: efflux RND transporter periplasmic adaptor subunit [Deferrisomatales bacterium]|nr:efflux RND transporter periplasmic adaptor subunit [Deferrisomatales bacterium]